MRQIKRTILWLLLIGVAVSCTTPEQAKSNVSGVRAQLPEPPEAQLLSEEILDASGSQDECVGAVYVLVYGTQKEIDDIAAFYSEKLQLLGWKPDTGKITPGFAKGDGKFEIALIPLDPKRGSVFGTYKIPSNMIAPTGNFTRFFEVDIFFTSCPS